MEDMDEAVERTGEDESGARGTDEDPTGNRSKGRRTGILDVSRNLGRAPVKHW